MPADTLDLGESKSQMMKTKNMLFLIGALITLFSNNALSHNTISSSYHRLDGFLKETSRQSEGYGGGAPSGGRSTGGGDRAGSGAGTRQTRLDG